MRRRQQIERAADSVGGRDARRCRIHDLDERLPAHLGVETGGEHLGGQVEINTAGTPGRRGADRPRDADADILRAIDAIRRLGIGARGGELVHLLVIALFEIDDRAVGGAADQHHRKAVRRRVGQRDEAVQKAGGRDGHADAGLLRQKPGDRGGVAGRLLVPETEIANAFGLREAQEVGDRDAGHPENRIDPVQLEGIHHEVEAVGHLPWHVRCAHIAHRCEICAGSNDTRPRPSTAHPPYSPADSDNQELCTNVPLLKSAVNQQRRFSHRLYWSSGRRHAQANQGTTVYHEIAANLVGPAKPRRGAQAGLRQHPSRSGEPGRTSRPNPLRGSSYRMRISRPILWSARPPGSSYGG